MTKKKSTAKKKPAAAKKKSAVKGAPAEFQGLPKASEMRLRRNGIEAADGTGIALAFNNGYSVTLRAPTTEERDILVAWLRKRLGADRT